MKTFQFPVNKMTMDIVQNIFKSSGGKGLRHFLALGNAMSRQRCLGLLKWSLTEHLESLGYSVNSKGFYDLKIVKETVKVILGMAGTNSGQCITAPDKFQYMKPKELHSQTVTLSFSKAWYKGLFIPGVNQLHRYTKIPVQILRESHKCHPLIFMLVPLFYIKWRIEKTEKIKFKVKTLMQKCNLNFAKRNDMNGDTNRSKRINQLFRELDYMASENYVAEWSTIDEKSLSKSIDTLLETTLLIQCPYWLWKGIESIKKSQECNFTVTSKV